MELNSSQKLLVKSKHDIANVGIACADLILPLNFLRLLIPAARRRGSRRPRQLACSALLAGLDVHRGLATAPAVVALPCNTGLTVSAWAVGLPGTDGKRFCCEIANIH